VQPPSQSTHQPSREAGQLLPISVTLPAPATLHETPYTAFTATESCAEYRLRLRGNYRDKRYATIRPQYRDIRYDMIYRAITI